MNRLKFLAGLCLTACLATVPAFAQTDTKAEGTAETRSGAGGLVLEGWNDICRKLIAIARICRKTSTTSNRIPTRAHSFSNCCTFRRRCTTLRIRCWARKSAIRMIRSAMN